MDILILIHQRKINILKQCLTLIGRDDLDISKEEILIQILEQCKIDKDIFFETIKDPIIKEKLKDATKNAHEKEVFGAPTFIVNNKIFWGQDRLEFALDEYNK